MNVFCVADEPQVFQLVVKFVAVYVVDKRTGGISLQEVERDQSVKGMGAGRSAVFEADPNVSVTDSSADEIASSANIPKAPLIGDFVQAFMTFDGHPAFHAVY